MIPASDHHLVNSTYRFELIKYFFTILSNCNFFKALKNYKALCKVLCDFFYSR